MLIPRIAALICGAAFGVVAAIWKTLEGRAPSGGNFPAARPVAPRPIGLARPAPAAKTSVEAANRSVAAQYTALKTQIARLENRLERHDTQLLAIPSTEQIGAAVDRAFERSAKALDERFAEQASSIESLKEMVTQTDELLEKVLDSIYSLPEMTRDPEAERENRRPAR